MVPTQRKGRPPEAVRFARTSISFPPDVYEILERIAQEQKVSTAWVVREAAEKYISERAPLFNGRG
jgi:predicted DNA-binding protein